MDWSLVRAVRKDLQKQSPKRLAALYRKRSGWYSEGLFQAIWQMLVARRVNDPSHDLTAPEPICSLRAEEVM